MSVITSDFSFRIDAFQQFRCRFIIWVLWHEFAMYCQVKDFRFCLFYNSLQIGFPLFNNIYYTHPFCKFRNNSTLFVYRRYGDMQIA